jgi:alanine racemase
MPTRPCWVEISTQAFQSNYRYLKSLVPAGVELLAVVKSDAYGHSLALCAPAAVTAGAQWLGVTSVDEAVTARQRCPKSRLLVMSGAFPGQGSAVIEHKLTPVVWELWQLKELDSAARVAGVPAQSLNVHLEIDTGMSRQGVGPDRFIEVLSRLDPRGPLRLEGVMTHLLAADETDAQVTHEQMQRLDEVLGAIRNVTGDRLKPNLLSVGSSAAMLGGEVDAIVALAKRWSMQAMIRPGLALYGVVPQFHPNEPAAAVAARKSLQPVLSWKTKVVGVRRVPAGAVVGYNGTFVATEPMLLALLPVGYADGLDRLLGNHFSLLVRGERAPLVGRISMDLAVIDVTEIPDVTAGDEVVILGKQGNSAIDAFDHAEATQTIPWEVFTRIGTRVPRIPV